MKIITVTMRLALSFILVGVSLHAAVGAEKSDGSTGSIRGTVSVDGIKSPKDVLVYVENVPGDWQPSEESAHMDQVRLVFTPNVLPIVKGTTVEFLNSDPIQHNVFWPKGKGAKPRNLGTHGKGYRATHTFKKLGDVNLLCNVHSEMSGHIVILQNPFFAVVGKDGEYEIENVPSGDFTVKTWYKNSKKLKSGSAEASVVAGETTELDFSLSK